MNTNVCVSIFVCTRCVLAFTTQRHQRVPQVIEVKEGFISKSGVDILAKYKEAAFNAPESFQVSVVKRFSSAIYEQDIELY